MYKDFFGFEKLPFSITPDPKFVYYSKSHHDALAQMLYGIQERKGLMVCTGEVGVGKTTMIFTLMSHLGKDVISSMIFDTHVDPPSLYKYMFSDFDIQSMADNRADMAIALKGYLVRRLEEGKKTLLILDEAHNLQREIFNEVVHLTNFETRSNKLLQILLVGQPELKSVLNSMEFRQLKQRISLRTSIRPLTVEDTKNYIRHRLKAAGAANTEIFTDDAQNLIHAYSRGLPRMVNTICDNSLLLGFSKREHIVGAPAIQETYAELMDLDSEGEEELPEIPIPPVVNTPSPPQVIQTAPVVSPPAPVVQTAPVAPPPAPVVQTAPVAPPPAPVVQTAPVAPPPAPVVQTAPVAPPPAPVAGPLSQPAGLSHSVPPPAPQPPQPAPQPAPLPEVPKEQIEKEATAVREVEVLDDIVAPVQTDTAPAPPTENENIPVEEPEKPQPPQASIVEEQTEATISPDFSPILIGDPQATAPPDNVPMLPLTDLSARELMPSLLADDPSSRRQYHLLTARLEAISRTSDIRTLVVTSSVPREGKTITAINLAFTLAQESSNRVILVDADLRQPALHTYFGHRSIAGATEVLKGKLELERAIHRVQYPNMYVMFAGKNPENPLDLISSIAMQDLVAQLRQRFHYVIIDSPPVAPIADSFELAGMTDGIILVVRSRYTGQEVVQQVIEDLDQANILGIVLNDQKVKFTKSKYHYGYGYSTSPKVK